MNELEKAELEKKIKIAINDLEYVAPELKKEKIAIYMRHIATSMFEMGRGSKAKLVQALERNTMALHVHHEAGDWKKCSNQACQIAWNYIGEK